jgi:WD40 repeat protein
MSLMPLFTDCSWSPDGAHITASNATNNKGFVFIASVITRNTWTSEISLVGHENTVEVAASIVSPPNRWFRTDQMTSPTTPTYFCVIPNSPC